MSVGPVVLMMSLFQTVTGPVKSNILKAATMPEGSLYTPVKERYESANAEIFGSEYTNARPIYGPIRI